MITASGCAPVARMPSTGRGSMASTASENSLASTPVVCTHSASTPENGPRPTAETNSSAKTISLIARKASSMRRTGWCIHHGVRLDDASSASGTEQTTASAVPHSAISTVTSSSERSLRQSENCGGKNPCTYWAMLPLDWISSSGRMSAPFQLAASIASSAPHISRLCSEALGGGGTTVADGAFTSGASLRAGDLAAELRQLGVDVGQLLGLVGGAARRGGPDGRARAGELDLAHRDQLRVARRAEAAVLDVGEDRLLARILAVRQHEVLDQLLGGRIEILAPDDRVARDQRRAPDLAHLPGLFRMRLLEALHVLGVVGGDVHLLVHDRQQVRLVAPAGGTLEG